MVRLTPLGSKVAIPAFLTCGGDRGPLFEVARRIAGAEIPDGGTNIWDFVPEEALPLTKEAIGKLEDQAVNDLLIPVSFLVRYGSILHTKDMSSPLNLSSASVAAEIPSKFRPLAHTMLPIKNGVYVNEDIHLPIRNFVQIGPQTGNLVVHLAGCFASHCSNEEIEKILAEQASDESFMKMARELTELNYENYPILRESTRRAAERLGLK